MKAELVENRIIVWSIPDSKKLFAEGYFGKPIGISKPKPDEIDVPLILDLIEGHYLQLKSKIQIYKNKKKISKDSMLYICRDEYHNFDIHLCIYTALNLLKSFFYYRNNRD